MEHLPLPHDATAAILRIPYVCTGPYDRGIFSEYPKRLIPPRGSLLVDSMQDPSYWQKHLADIPTRELEDIIQTWLLFGLLHEILGEELSAEAVCVIHDPKEPDKPCLSTAGLYSATQKWMEGIQAHPMEEPERKQRYSTLVDCLWHVKRCLLAIRVFRISKTAEATLPSDLLSIFNPVIVCSIASVAEVMTLAVDKILNSDGKSENLIGFSDFSNLLPRQSMLMNGWCPSEIPTLKSTFPTFAAHFYMMHMRRPFRDGDHVACDQNKCMSLQNNLVAGYEIAHRLNGCTCSMVSVEKDRIASAFTGDSYAVLRITGGDRPKVEVVAADIGTRYLAISHVWADGMGNPYDNAMPACQLNYLVEVIGAVKERLVREGDMTQNEELYVFIDTLLFPTGTDNLNLKNNALGKMAKIYQRATCVLVLDKALLEYHSDTLDQLEALFRLFSSRWITRLWTLQEGAFAQYLTVQLNGHLVSFKELFQKVREAYAGFGQQAMVAVALLAQYYHMRRWSVNQWKLTVSNHVLATVSYSIWSRQCSVATDEALCLAALLDLDIQHVAVASPEERMQALWHAMDASPIGIPSQIIVFNTPKIQSAGFHWAPSTLLRISGCQSPFTPQHQNLKSARGHITGEGLQVQFPGVQISVPAVSIRIPGQLKSTSLSRELVVLKGPEGVWYRIADPRASLGAESRTKPMLGELIQRSTPQAVVLAAETLPRMAKHGQSIVEPGVYGPVEQRSDGKNFIKTELIVALERLQQRDQYLYHSADTCVAEIRLSIDFQSLVASADASSDPTSPEAVDYAPKVITLVESFARRRLESDDVLAAHLSSLSVHVFVRYLIFVYRILFGGYGIITTVYHSEQDWIVD